MKGKFIAWLLLITLSSLALTNSSFKLEHEGVADLSRFILQEHETDHGLQGAVKPNGSEDDDGRGSHKEQEMVVSEKGERGKGGANVAHHPRQTERSSATPHVYLVTKTMLHLSFSLILLLFCKLV